VTCLFVRIDVL